MIKVHLLDSVTDKHGSVSTIEKRVADPRTQGKLLMLAIGVLAVVVMGFDYVSANSSHRAAEEKLKQEQETARQMELVRKEIAVLENKTKDVQARIDAIRKLRASQEGPVAVLSSINERLPRLSTFFLETIEQKDDGLTITGDSPNEAAVTQFGRSLEFSSGLFTNVNIETQRKNMELPAGAAAAPSSGEEKAAPKPETVGFTIRCKYTQPGSSKDGDQSATPPAAANPPAAKQVAQK